ncbi:hypothetical protein V499_03903 [Pseudogymnoascus sp. VKM F-103]|nr:hypothetical protein V499_03903 [Pseudogymnoascus sp. VKM F-103]
MKPEHKDADAVVRTCSYHRLDFGAVMVRSRPYVTEAVQDSLQASFEIPPSSGLGDMHCLPAELMTMVLENLDILSYFRFRRVNRYARILSTSPREYQLVAKYGVEGLRAMLRSDCARAQAKRPKKLILLSEAVAALDGQGILKKYSGRNPLRGYRDGEHEQRFMAATQFPWYNASTGKAEHGLSCKGCYVRLTTRHRDFDNHSALSAAEFLVHFATCVEAQDIWAKSQQGTVPVEDSEFIHRGGFYIGNSSNGVSTHNFYGLLHTGRDDCYFRILAGTNVKYITIKAGALDGESLMDMPLDFQNIIPPLPYDKDDWNSAYITRIAATGELEPALSQTTLPRVQTVWHPKMINFLDLERTKLLSLLAQECKWKQGSAEIETRDQKTMIAKMARFPWEIQYIEAETRIYQLLQPLQITPTFLGHIHEADRVIGVLLEKVEGRPANSGDLEICKAALQRLHDLRILHGDCNRHNFIISADEKVTLIDFDNAKVDADAEMMEKEMASLEEQLREETGRGEGFIQVESDDENPDIHVTLYY